MPARNKDMLKSATSASRLHSHSGRGMAIVVRSGLSKAVSSLTLNK